MGANSAMVILAACLMIAIGFAGCAGNDIFGGVGKEYKIQSPNGRIEITASIEHGTKWNGGFPELKLYAFVYSVSLDGKTIIDKSMLGLKIDGIPVDSGFQIENVDYTNRYDVYDIPAGKTDTVVDSYNQMKVSLLKNGITRVDVYFRAYDDGIGFRYGIPEQEGLGEFSINSEMSTFQFTDNHRIFAMRPNSYETGYEFFYDEITLADVTAETIACVPMLIDCGSCWMGIMEANLRNYGGMYLKGSGKASALETTIAPSEADSNMIVKTSGPFFTPWRAIMIGDDACTLVESNLLLNLNDPCALEDTSWIKAGKISWPWWKFVSSTNTGLYNHYVDFAAENGIENVIIDAGWYCDEVTAWADPLNQDPTDNKMSAWIDIQAILAHAKEAGVGIMLWVHEDTLNLKLEEALDAYREWGVAGVKVDGPGGDSVERVNLYWKIAEEAAKRQLLLDFHGAYEPDGMRRTMPHVLTREGIRGQEHRGPHNIIPEEIDKAAGGMTTANTLKHDVTIPFTRMLAGPMDYTPGAFGIENFNPIFPNIVGTRCRQMAMFAVYESELQMLIDAPEDYVGQEGFEFVQAIPAAWDDTKAINGDPGKYVTIARRSGSEWFVGSMNGDDPVDLKISMDFLGEGAYTATVWTDGSNAAFIPTDIASEEMQVTSADTLSVSLISGGGYCMHIVPSAGR